VYKLYQPKDLNCHFVVICPESNVSHLRNTAGVLKSYGFGITAVLDERASAGDLAEAKAICPTFCGGKTIASLINCGVRNGGPEWNMIVIAGSWVRQTIVKKMSHFVESDLDVLYPVMDRQSNFQKGTLNGLMMHQKTFELVGPFDEANPLETCKMIWCMDAMTKGVAFKAVVGAKVC
jgi:hypothetical protein